MNLVTHAHIALPTSNFVLVSELIKKLGGEIVEQSDERIVVPPIPEQERVGRMLKGLRLRVEMTQKELAKTINVPQSHISEYEANKRAIPADKHRLLAEVLHTVEEHFAEK